MGYIHSYVLSVYFQCACIYSTFSAVKIGKQDYLEQSNWSVGPLLAAKKWSPGPVMTAEFGPAKTTTVGKRVPFLATKGDPGDHILAGPSFV